jgi:hypothetical protein
MIFNFDVETFDVVCLQKFAQLPDFKSLISIPISRVTNNLKLVSSFNGGSLAFQTTNLGMNCALTWISIKCEHARIVSEERFALDTPFSTFLGVSPCQAFLASFFNFSRVFVSLSFHFYALCAISLISRRFFLPFFINFSIFGESRNELCTREREAEKKKKKKQVRRKLDRGGDNEIEPVSKEVAAFAVQSI